MSEEGKMILEDAKEGMEASLERIGTDPYIMSSTLRDVQSLSKPSDIFSPSFPSGPTIFGPGDVNPVPKPIPQEIDNIFNISTPYHFF